MTKKLTKNKIAGPKTVPAPQQQPEQTPIDWSQYHIHILIPCYAGQIFEATMTSLIQFICVANQIGLKWSLNTMVKESLIPRGRNSLCAIGMENPHATHFMFIDSDIRFQADSILGMLAAEKDVIGGLYPKKGLPIDYNFNGKNGGLIDGPCIQVETVATGFLLFRKSVYEKLIQAYPETKYRDDIGLGKQYEPHLYAIFDTIIDEHGFYLSEDWTFCRRWIEQGGDIWIDTRVLLSHIGFFEYAGDFSAIERKIGIKRVDPNTPEGKILQQQMEAQRKGQNNGTQV
jgi:hypothetical protein